MNPNHVHRSTGPMIDFRFAGCCATVLTAMCSFVPAQAASPTGAEARTGTKYKADGNVQAVLEELASLKGKPIETLTPEEARKQPTPTDAAKGVLKKKGTDTQPTALVPGVTSADRSIAGAAGALSARTYTPAGSGPFPVVVYFHGGGWVIADKDVYDDGARGLAKQDNAVVVIAVYPVAQTGNLETASYLDSATAKPLNKAMIGWFVDKLFANPADKTNPRIDLVNANLAGLPPVTIINAQIDPLREDGALLAAALKQAGVKVDRKVYDGVSHEFFGTAAVVKDTANAQAYAGKQLKQAFGG